MNRPLHAVVLALGALLLSGGAAHAGDFTKDGFDVQWSLNTSFGTNLRTASADKSLVSFGNGGKSGIGNDNGDLNFNNFYSNTMKAVGDIEVRRDKFGVLVRAKAWYDFAGLAEVPHGSYANGYVPNTKLSYSSFDALSKYTNAALLDAYAYANLNLGSEKPLNIRVGKQVVNWGESLFIAGINQSNAFDVTAAHRPGTQVKEILLPLPQVYANLGLSKAVTVEGYYEFLWDKTILDGCGTYWSPSTLLNCSSGTVVGPGVFSDQQLYNGIPALGGLNMRMSVRELRPRDQGEYGMALRYRAAELDTDFGLYYVNYHTRVPNVSAMLVPSTIPGSIWSMAIPGVSRPAQVVLDYSAEDIKVAAISSSSSVEGWTVLTELSHTFGTPVQINGPDFLNGIVGGIGPVGFLAARPNGSLIHGYNRKDKTQFQMSMINAFPRKFKAEQLTLIAEAGYQYWSGIGSPTNSTRYGRAFVFSSGPVIAPGVCQTTPTLNTNPSYCENEGYVTRNAIGYRILTELSYPNVFKGVNVKPRLFWSHDVKGYSGDATFSQGRMALSPGMRFERNNKYYVELTYSYSNHGAKYDEFHDRDFFSFVIGKNW